MIIVRASYFHGFPARTRARCILYTLYSTIYTASDNIIILNDAFRPEGDRGNTRWWRRRRRHRTVKWSRKPQPILLSVLQLQWRWRVVEATVFCTFYIGLLYYNYSSPSAVQKKKPPWLDLKSISITTLALITGNGRRGRDVRVF